MGPWEYLDDDGVFGAPGIEQIKADPGVINWEWWDNVFTHPPEGSPFWYATDPGVGWQGNWRQIFGPLKQHGVKPIVSLRVQNAQTQPDWAAALNPPNTEAGRNEWWEHVFSVVYWMNVRNDYRVDDWEIGNEANHKGQGWAGTEDDYWDFARLTHDAIDYVYRRFLPHRRHRIYAPVSAGTSVNEAGERFGWIKDALQKVPECFDCVDYHDFSDDPTQNIRDVHAIMDAAGQGRRDLWITEWGPVYDGSQTYDEVPGGLLMLQNLIRMSRPGADHVFGNCIVNLYDSPTRKYLVGRNGERRLGFYAMRMGIRALQGGRPLHDTTSDTADLLAATTRTRDRIDLLVTNANTSQAYDVAADLSRLSRRGAGELREFSDRVQDQVVGRVDLHGGRANFRVPAGGAVLAHFDR